MWLLTVAKQGFRMSWSKWHEANSANTNYLVRQNQCANATQIRLGSTTSRSSVLRHARYLDRFHNQIHSHEVLYLRRCDLADTYIPDKSHANFGLIWPGRPQPIWSRLSVVLSWVSSMRLSRATTQPCDLAMTNQITPCHHTRDSPCR